MTIRVRRLVSAGALAVAAVAAPLAIAMGTGEVAQSADACRAMVTTQGSDPVCADGPDNGTHYNIGTPFGVYGPNGGTGVGGYNGGVIAGPLVPGRTWTSTSGG